EVEPGERATVVAQFAGDQTTRVQIAPLGEGDDLLDIGLHGLRLGKRGHDLTVLEHRDGEVPQRGCAVRGGATEFVSAFAVTHGSILRCGVVPPALARVLRSCLRRWCQTDGPAGSC